MTVKIAFLGCAHIHTPAFVEKVRKRADFQPVAVWDHDAARAAANMFDPEAIVLGGDVLEFGDDYFEHFKEVCARSSEARKLGKAPLILRSNFGRRGVAVGGAQLILDELVF